MNFLLVFLGGGAGSVVRYLFSLAGQKLSLNLPYATLLSNVLACIIYALVLLVIDQENNAHSQLKTLLIAGFCGGLSTFSGFGFETYLLLKGGFVLYGALNIFFNTAVCLAVFYFLSK